jgi:hypothetical protein
MKQEGAKANEGVSAYEGKQEINHGYTNTFPILRAKVKTNLADP